MKTNNRAQNRADQDVPIQDMSQTSLSPSQVASPSRGTAPGVSSPNHGDEGFQSPNSAMTADHRTCGTSSDHTLSTGTNRSEPLSNEVLVSDLTVRKVLNDLDCSSESNFNRLLKIQCANYVLNKDNNLMLRQLCSIRNEKLGVIPDFDVRFPLKTIDDCRLFNDYLSNANAIRTVANYVGNLGGETIRNTVYNVMELFFYPEIAKNMNWLGKHGQKCALRKSFPNIVDVICEIIKNCHNNPRQDDIHDAMKRWLKKAPHVKST